MLRAMRPRLIALLLLAALAVAEPTRADGDVSVVVVDGTLDIRGDDGANAIAVGPGASDEGFVVTGENGTLVSGFGTAIVDGARRVRIDLGAGDDSLTIRGATVLGTLDVRLATGDDQLTLEQVRAEGNVTVKAGRGRDVLRVQGDARFLAKLRLRAGEGADDVAFAGATLRGRVTIYTAGGADDVVLSGLDTETLAFVEVDTGDADDTVRVESSTFGAGLRVALDDADDLLLLEDVTLHEGATADGGDGRDEAIQRGRVVRGPLKTVDLDGFEIQD